MQKGTAFCKIKQEINVPNHDRLRRRKIVQKCWAISHFFIFRSKEPDFLVIFTVVLSIISPGFLEVF